MQTTHYNPSSIQARINEFNQLTKCVDVNGNVYRSISESRRNAILKAEQHLANGGSDNDQKVLCMLTWA